MTAIDFILSQTERQYKGLLDRARKVPADKLDWKPLDEGRSVLDVCQECAHSLLWPVPLIKDRTFAMDEAVMQEYQTTRSAWTTLDAVESAMHKRFGELKAFLSNVPESDWEAPIDLPWGPMTVIEAAALPSWNLSYHTGQVNYIQTLYGDKDM